MYQGGGRQRFFGGHGAVLPYGGNFLAISGFSFFGGNDFGGSSKPKYGGIFSAVTTLVEAANQNMAVLFRRQCNTAVIFWR